MHWTQDIESRFDEVDLVAVREALEASWSIETSYGGVSEPGNPALGQCYPTSRVVQRFLPASEIVKGTVWTGVRSEIHFWNELQVESVSVPVDFTWQQFPLGSVVTTSQVLDRTNLGDTPPTIARCERLLGAVIAHLSRRRIS